MTERSAETGEHYITRNGKEYLQMLRQAAGGGLVMSVTTMVKFGLAALAFSAFWGGFWAGINYAISFVLIQLLHFTVATKQPAMTAPAMAAKLKDINEQGAVDSFVDEVANLTRTQVAAILGKRNSSSFPPRWVWPCSTATRSAARRWTRRMPPKCWTL